jgi:hypothetical protein
MRTPLAVTLALVLFVSPLRPLVAQSPFRSAIESPAFTPVTPPFTVIDIQQSESGSQVALRFLGGSVGAFGAFLGLVAAAVHDTDFGRTEVYAATATGAALGAALTTWIWERPKVGLFIGAAVGALPMLWIERFDNSQDGLFLMGLIGAPLGAALGQIP